MKDFIQNIRLSIMAFNDTLSQEYILASSKLKKVETEAGVVMERIVTQQNINDGAVDLKSIRKDKVPFNRFFHHYLYVLSFCSCLSRLLYAYLYVKFPSGLDDFDKSLRKDVHTCFLHALDVCRDNYSVLYLNLDTKVQKYLEKKTNSVL